MSILFIILCLLAVLCFVGCLTCCFGFFLTVNFLPLSGSFWWLVIEYNKYTVLILLMLVICFLYVYWYTSHYFGEGFVSEELNKIICLFVAVMASLVCTGDFLLTLVFWEYLGVVSFFLILFYDSYLSLRSSIVTLVSSRFGDVCLFILLCIAGYTLNSFLMPLVLFFLIIFTKSAAFPFISWLLEAMRAPTPVSSLVHSSTLVAAGVWFAMRYDFLLFLSSPFWFSVSLLMTIFITGVSCFFFLDLKKIVALSTCNNISWCVFYLIFGDSLLSLFQLVSHGVSKCILFTLVGDVMSGAGGAQSSNCVYSPRLYGNWGIFGLFSVVLGLSGAPFIGVFFTKHFLLSSFMGIENMTLSLMVLLCVFLSYFYSFRMCSILVNLKASTVFGVLYIFDSGIMVYAWLFVNYFLSSSLDELVLLNSFNSTSLVVFQMISCFTAWFMYSSVLISNWSSSLFGCDNIVELMYSMFFYLLRLANAFLYRWDSYIICLFSGVGVSSLKVYAVNFLNIVILILFVFLMCWVIVY